MERLTSIDKLYEFQKRLKQETDPQRLRVRICMTGCRAFGAVEVCSAFKQSIAEKGLQEKVDIIETGCHGFCARAPVAAIDPYGFFYQQIAPRDVPHIVEETLIKGKPVDKYIYQHPPTKELIPLEKGSLLPGADEDCAAQLRADRSHAHAGLYNQGWLSGYCQSLIINDP